VGLRRESLAIRAVQRRRAAQVWIFTEEFLKLTILDLRPEEDRDAVRNYVANLHGGSMVSAWRHRHKDGGSSGWRSPRRTSALAATTSGWCWRTTHARKQAEDALRESESRFARLSESGSSHRRLGFWTGPSPTPTTPFSG